MILVKYQTLNGTSDNLSFEVFFLIFANFSPLTGQARCRPFGDVMKFRAKSSEREGNAFVLGRG